MTRALAIDIGGTKTLVALVENGRVVDERLSPTARGASPDAWCDAISEAASGWNNDYAVAGAAVTGVIAAGRWTAMNPETLPVPAGFPLSNELSHRLGRPVSCYNDAQAAAWGEHRYGAGEGRDLLFVTVSTGIGGGAVANGRLLVGRGGLAGSAGLTRAGNSLRSDRIEDMAAGRWIAAEARRSGHETDAQGVFSAAAAGSGWASAIVAASAEAVSALLVNLQLLFDPPLIVVGGGVGLAPGYLGLLRERVAGQPGGSSPTLQPAALGKYAGIIGVADLAAATSGQ